MLQSFAVEGEVKSPNVRKRSTLYFEERRSAVKWIVQEGIPGINGNASRESWRGKEYRATKKIRDMCPAPPSDLNMKTYFIMFKL